MADRTIYIVSHNNIFKTNRTNITRLWEVFEEEWGLEVDLEISYHLNESDEYFTRTPARKQKIKGLCQEAYLNRIYVHPVGDFMIDKMAIFQDIIGGREKCLE